MSANMMKKMELDQAIFHKRSSSNLSSSDVARIMAALGKKWIIYFIQFPITILYFLPESGMMATMGSQVGNEGSLLNDKQGTSHETILDHLLQGKVIHTYS